MTQYYIYRLERGLSAAERQATDHRIGELAAAAAELRSSMAGELRRRLSVLSASVRAVRKLKGTGVAAAALARR